MENTTQYVENVEMWKMPSEIREIPPKMPTKNVENTSYNVPTKNVENTNGKN